MENNRVRYFSKEYWKLHWKFILINVAIFLGSFLILLAIDLLTKEFIFKWEDKKNLIVNTDYEFGNKFIIFKSVLHNGTTIGFFETNLPFLHTISFLIFFGALWAVTFIKEKKLIYITVFLAVISAGSFGNMIDRFLFKGVRDIINLPWVNKGVFNIADVWLVIGAIGLFVAIIVQSIISSQKAKNKKEEFINSQL
ncbi:signal peptidase II [Metamycoplasma alkalescens]|nr:signal peptidase II [Metamycoplasma alkalescens]